MQSESIVRSIPTPPDVLAFGDAAAFIRSITIVNQSNAFVSVYPGASVVRGTPITVAPSVTSAIPVAPCKEAAVEYGSGIGTVYVHWSDETVIASTSGVAPASAFQVTVDSTNPITVQISPSSLSTVAVSSIPATTSVSISTLPDVTIGSMPAIDIAPNQSVNIGTMPDVTLALSTVAVSSIPATTSVSISALPNVTIGSMPAIDIAPNQTVLLNPNQDLNLSLVLAEQEYCYEQTLSLVLNSAVTINSARNAQYYLRILAITPTTFHREGVLFITVAWANSAYALTTYKNLRDPLVIAAPNYAQTASSWTMSVELIADDGYSSAVPYSLVYGYSQV